MNRVIRNRVGTGLIAFAMVLAQVLLPVSSAYAMDGANNGQNGTNGPDAEPKKVYVCKYVGIPGIDERLKTGNDGIIEVSVNAISKNSWDGVTVPAWFSDAHDRSYVIGFVDKDSPAPTSSACPPADLPGRITTPSVEASVICGPENDKFTVPVNENYSVVDNLDGTYSLTAKTGYIFTTTLTNTVKIKAPTDKNTPCPKPTVCTNLDSVHATNLNNSGWTLPADAEYVDGGMKLNVSGEWDTTYISRAMVGPLADIGSEVSFDASPEQYAGIHIKTNDGRFLTYEYGPGYDNKWWSKSAFGVESGQGYATFDTLENIVAANPDVMTSMLYVLYTHPSASNSVVSSVTVGCKNYTFDKETPVRVPTECTVDDNMFIESWSDGTYDYPYAGGAVPGTFKFSSDGLHLSTPAISSYVFGEMSAGETPVVDIDDMSYNTYREVTSTGNSQVVTAYIVSVDRDGNLADSSDVTYLFYEPAYNGTVISGQWQTWDVDADNAKLWSFELTDGNPTLTWSQFVTDYPNAIALTYGFNQGTYNQGTDARVQDIKFDCATTSFSVPGSGGGEEEPEVPVVPVTPVTPTVPVVPVLPVGGKGALLPEELPMTGENGSIVFTWIALLAAILTYGAVYYLQPKKRFEQ